MTLERGDFSGRVRSLLEREGVVLTDGELSRMTDRYPRCGGKDPWDVREYARRARPGAREYRVMRGASTEDVYCSVERVSATAVRMALNELESQDLTRRASGLFDLGT